MGSRAHFIKLTISGNYYGNKASQPISTKDSTEVYIGSKLPLMVSFMQWGPVLCNLFINFSLLSIASLCFNPIPTGGGGGGQFDPPPPAQNPWLPRDTPFHEFFLSSLTHLFTPSLRKSDHRSRGHVTFCTRTSAQNCPKSACLCTKHMEMTDFLKMR